jgi:hypothetical protein
MLIKRGTKDGKLLVEETEPGVRLEFKGPDADQFEQVNPPTSEDECYCCQTRKFAEQLVAKTTIPERFDTEDAWFDFSSELEGDVTSFAMSRLASSFTELDIDIFEGMNHHHEDAIRERVAEAYDIADTVLNAVLEKVNCTAFRKQLEDLEIIEKSADAATA